MNGHIIANSAHSMEQLAARVIAENIAAGRTIVVAESCTGGMVAAALTDIAGSSAVFSAGIVTYSNEAKQSFLGVSSEILDTFGAVSIACVWAMAAGALERSGADIAIAVSGIAGPGGGTPQKPVGTVVFSRVLRGQNPDQAYGIQRNFDAGLSRREIRRQATLFALELLLPESDDLGCSP
ncbi:MAG: CinA family protein [Pseudomonadota bacterium]